MANIHSFDSGDVSASSYDCGSKAIEFHLRCLKNWDPLSDDPVSFRCMMIALESPYLLVHPIQERAPD
jgi:hypothetical protein